MAKVYLSAPYHWYNACAIAGCDENTHNNEYLDVLEKHLHACGIETKRGYRRPPKDSTTDGDELMIQAVRESDAWGADIHYISHTNAFNGTVRGYRPMIYPGSTRGKNLADCILKYRKQIYDQPIRLSETDEWYELRVPAAASYYEEHVFHDNKADAQWFHDNMEKIAQATAKGMCDYFGIAYVDPNAKPEKPTSEAKYTVKAGDTLWGIAQAYGTTHQELAAYNGIQDPSLIYPGQVIKIPGGDTSAPAQRKYTVKAGDSLWQIAQDQLGDGSRYPEIQKLNGITGTLIHPGDVLALPEK